MLSPQILAINTWLARNKSSATPAEVLAKINTLPSTPSSGVLTNFDENLLWNTLFYHVLHQNNFTQKETLMQLLFLKHVIKNKSSLGNEATAKTLLQAQIVLPAILFDENEMIADSDTQSRTAKPTDDYSVSKPEAMRRFQKISQANESLNKLERLKTGLQKAQKKHQKLYQTAYSAAYKSHQGKNINPVLQQYEAEVAEMQRNFCASQRTDIPYDPKNPCNQPPRSTAPKLPAFEFSFQPDNDLGFLQQNLSEANYLTLQALASHSTTINDFSRRNSFMSDEDPLDWFGPSTSLDEIITDIDGNILQNQEVITQNTTPSNVDATLYVDGISFPALIADADPAFTMVVCSEPYFNGIENCVQFDATIKVPDNTWNIKSVKTSFIDKVFNSANVEVSSTLLSSGVFVAQRNGNIIFLDGLFIDKNFPIADFQNGIYDFTIEIEFDNRTVMFYEITFWSTFSCNEKILTSKNTEPNSEPTTTVAGFVPPGFGVKQLGIADYKKVEQTLHGYVEGEVAHIENVMARERREKSTKKSSINETFDSETTNTEREQISDTATTKRFEMQNEASLVMQETKDQNVNAQTSYSAGGFSIGIAAGMATHSARDESIKQAVTQAQEITSKVTDRLTSKVQRERSVKMIESFEEQNIHEFDNRKGDKHIVGVYRWVDKVYKNQLYNYGKRLMFEFMIPEPAKLHLLGMTQKAISGELLVKQADPRLHKDPNGTHLSVQKNLSSAANVNAYTTNYWGGIYNVKLEPEPAPIITIGKSFSETAVESAAHEWDEAIAGNHDIEIPEFYVAKQASGKLVAPSEPAIGQFLLVGTHNVTDSRVFDVKPFTSTIPISYSAVGYHAVSVTVEVTCELTKQGKQIWQQKTFKAIIDAYEKHLAEYTKKVEAELAKGVRMATENPAFYRQTENLILRKNCISYLIDQKQNATQTYGQNMSNDKTSFGLYEVKPSVALDNYAALAKFLEQAFEWNIMSYNFYPFYWGNRDNWAAAYQTDNNDALFRNFLQAGMARVVVTVNPGFEKAVSWYLQTGQVWNGGSTPLIEDPLFMAIVDELAQPTGKKEGKAWPSRVPTSLTILQANSIGLTVEKALPYDTAGLNDFEFPNEVPQQGEFDNNNGAFADAGTTPLPLKFGTISGGIEGNNGIQAKIELSKIDGTVADITFCNADGRWEFSKVPVGKYELNMDADNDFERKKLQVIEGNLKQVVIVNENIALEIKLVLQS